MTIADSNGDTPLISAVRNNKPSCVELILSMKYSELQKDLSIFECLLLATAEDKEDVLKIFLSYISPNDLVDPQPKKKRSILHLAVEKSSTACFSHLLDFIGADNSALINEKDEKGNTPLHKTASLNNVSMAVLLIKNGAKKDEVNNEGKKPSDLRPNSIFGDSTTSSLETALYSKVHRHKLKKIDPGQHRYHWNCDGRHLPSNSKCRLRTGINSQLLVCFSCSFCDYDLCDSCMTTYQCSEEDCALLNILSKKEVLYDELCKESFKSEEQRRDSIAGLVSLSQEYIQAINSEGNDSPVYLAIKLDRYACLELFLNNYRAGSICIDSKKILLSKISQSETGYERVLKLLLDKKLIDVNEKNSRGTSVLSLAVIGNNIECIRVLQEKGVNVNLKDNSKKNPLLWACTRDTVSFATFSNLLLEFPAIDILVSDEDGDTALMLCAGNNSKDKLETLCEKIYPGVHAREDFKIEVNKQNKNGTTGIIIITTITTTITISSQL